MPLGVVIRFGSQSALKSQLCIQNAVCMQRRLKCSKEWREKQDSVVSANACADSFLSDQVKSLTDPVATNAVTGKSIRA